MKLILTPRFVGIAFGLINLFGSCAEAQQTMLQVLEPGIGYARFKQWAVDSQMVFENFTKDSLVVRDTGLRQWETIRIQARFCGGDDYSGKASSIIIQQLFAPTIDVVTMQRDYVEFLAGKANVDGKFPGTFAGRRDRKDGNDGLAFSQEGEKGFWEVGLFKKEDKFALLQTTRRRDSVCQ
jgi:hypothetical protein